MIVPSVLFPAALYTILIIIIVYLVVVIHQ